MIEAVLSASPLFWPGVLGSLLLAALLSRRAGRLLRAHRAVGFLLLFAVGGVVTLTLLPDVRMSLWENARYGVRQCSFDRVAPHPLSELLTATQSSLNVALFVPLGATAALAGTWGRRIAAGTFAALLPVAVEAVQYAVPALGRACDGQDLLDNYFGLALGLLLGVLAGPLGRLAVRSTRRRATRPVARRRTLRP
ncbi:VanZ family protein [Kitasatospora camelliae]|uniref:VanZ family protein n=1 Tax=Kitasatospora camelliae TaxID=3156397 RepID=A0AAU8K556_9ACTN